MTNKFIKIMTKDQMGFSLASVMVAAGLLGILSLGVMRMMEMQGKSSKTAEVKTELIQLNNRIAQNLLDSKACVNTLGPLGDVAAIGEFDIIKSRQDSNLFEKGVKYGNNSLLVKNIKLMGEYDSPNKNYKSFTDSFSGNTGNLTIEVSFEKLSEMALGGKISTKRFPIMVEVDSTNTVVNCYSQLENAVSTSVDSACKSVGGDLSSVGGVSVCILKRLTVNATSGLEIGSDNSGAFQKKVQIGPGANLEVEGGVKVGEPVNCSGVNQEGTLRYNKTSKQMEFCNGSSWQSFGGWPAGSYCILRAGGSCPAGFNEVTSWVDVGTHAHQMCSNSAPGDSFDTAYGTWGHCRKTWLYCCK